MEASKRMEASKTQTASTATRVATRVLIGIQAGVLGGLAMLALLVIGSVWRGHAWWEAPNLFGSTFYGGRVFHSGANLATIAGSAFQLVICGVVGAIFGIASESVRSSRRMILSGILCGVLWYYLAYSWIWTRIDPMLVRYSPQPVTILSYLLFGLCLGYLGRHGREPIPTSELRTRDAIEAGPTGDALK